MISIEALQYKYLIPGAFFIGIFVTLIESICTGQVYLPTLVLLVKENVFEKWIFYLILYNIAFIMPLLLIFFLTYKGATTSKLIHWSKNNVVLTKIILGCFFLAMIMILLMF